MGIGAIPDALSSSPILEEEMITLHSPAFTHEGEILARHTCSGEDISPPLSWSGIPEGTQSLALIVDDPDAPDPAAPKMVWVHWVLYNMPPDTTELPENIADLPAGTQEGVNDWNRIGYGGPCPPIGRHRYYFKLYALDTVLDAPDKLLKAQLEEKMEGHILEQAELMGTYQKD